MSLNKFTNAEKGYELDLGVGADEMKANQIETINIDLKTINSKPYPPNAPGAGSVFDLDPIVYNPLPVSSTNATDFLVLSGSPGNVTEIKTINAAPYNGYKLRIGVTYNGATIGNVLIRGDDASKNPAEQKYPIVTNGVTTDVIVNPVSPNNWSWVELVYVENHPAYGYPAWACSVIQS
jgi:hypothetical protein